MTLPYLLCISVSVLLLWAVASKQLDKINSASYILFICLCVFFRLSTRALLIHFTHPQVGPRDNESFVEFSKLTDTLRKASSMAGAIVSLGKEFKISGTKEIRETWAPKVLEAMGYDNSRLATGYATLLYFTNEVLIFQFNYQNLISMNYSY